MLDVGPCKRVGVERFDVEDIWDDVHIQPETSADVRGLE